MRNKMIPLVAGMLMACLLPLAAQAQDWQTSTMLGSGSEYSSQVTAPGASGAIDLASTTGSGTGAASGPRRTLGDNPSDPGTTSDTSSPVGEPWVLLAFAACGAAVIALRRRAATQAATQATKHAAKHAAKHA